MPGCAVLEASGASRGGVRLLPRAPVDPARLPTNAAGSPAVGVEGLVDGSD